MSHIETSYRPGPYTLKNLGHEAFHQLPGVARGLPELVHSFMGDYKISPTTRFVVQLRYARLMGCPICANLIPPLGARLGFSKEAVQSALEGRPEGLSEEQYGAVVWAGELVEGGGLEPAEVPEAAQKISQLLREQLVIGTKLELVVHATGLMVLPHAMITRAFDG